MKRGLCEMRWLRNEVPSVNTRLNQQGGQTPSRYNETVTCRIRYQCNTCPWGGYIVSCAEHDAFLDLSRLRRYFRPGFVYSYSGFGLPSRQEYSSHRITIMPTKLVGRAYLSYAFLQLFTLSRSIYSVWEKRGKYWPIRLTWMNRYAA